MRIGRGTCIHAYSHLEGVSIGQNVSVGPFARLRPKTVIEDHVSVGNFIEVNRSTLKVGSKAKHVSYLGDATIGEKVNIGAGTVIANYDGYLKHPTLIEDYAFVGSNSTIIAPCHIGAGLIVAAGSTVSKNVAADSLFISRCESSTHEGWAKRYKVRKMREKSA